MTHDLLKPRIDGHDRGTVRNPATGNTMRIECVFGETWTVSMVGSCECGIIHEAEVVVAAQSIRSAEIAGESPCDDLLSVEIASCQTCGEST